MLWRTKADTLAQKVSKQQQHNTSNTMSENTPESILSTDLSNEDISRPLLPNGNYEFTVGEIKQVPTKDKQGQMLEITLLLKNPARSSKGEDINPGFKLTERIMLTPKGNLTEDSIRKSLKRFRMACVGNEPGSFAPVDQYLQHTILAKVSIEEDKEGKYDPQNRLRFVTKE